MAKTKTKSRCILCNSKLDKEGICEQCIVKIKNNPSEVRRSIGLNG